MIDKLVKFFGEVAFVELHVDDALWTGNCCYNLAKKSFLLQQNKKRTHKKTKSSSNNNSINNKTRTKSKQKTTTTKNHSNHKQTKLTSPERKTDPKVSNIEPRKNALVIVIVPAPT